MTVLVSHIKSHTTSHYRYSFLQKCSFCGRFGASVVCEMSDCGRIYHYPCAMAARTYQVSTTSWPNDKLVRFRIKRSCFFL